jgi:hypothetical protein
MKTLFTILSLAFCITLHAQLPETLIGSWINEKQMTGNMASMRNSLCMKAISGIMNP